jgi:hypothetical protein
LKNLTSFSALLASITEEIVDGGESCQPVHELPTALGDGQITTKRTTAMGFFPKATARGWHVQPPLLPFLVERDHELVTFVELQIFRNVVKW